MTTSRDLRLVLPPGSDGLALFGETLGRAGIALQGGGLITACGEAHARFLVNEPDRAVAALEAAGLTVAEATTPLVRRLRQGVPGQLGAIARALADAGVSIHVQYSDHAGRLILICDDPERAAAATRAWTP